MTIDKLLNFSVLGFSFAKEINHLTYKAVVMFSKDNVLENIHHGARHTGEAIECQFNPLLQGNKQLKGIFTHMARGRLIYKI